MNDVRTTRRSLVVVALVATTGIAHAKSKDEKLCSDLADFRASVTSLQQMGPQSTVGDLRQTESKLAATEKRIIKEAKRDKHARDLHAAIQDLDRAVNQLPDNSTLAFAQASIQDKVSAVSNAADSFSQTYCPTAK
jgi:predicted  nucleic acid-binding Zn-ribbon protein